MKNYYFYFDESFHTRTITKGSFNDTNFFNSYVSTGLGFAKKDKHNIIKKYEEFENKCFKKPISFNVIPQIDVFCENGYTKEEMKVVKETKKILHLDENTPISCTAVRVPVFNGHSEAVDIEFVGENCNEVTPDDVREVLSSAYGIKVIGDVDNYEYPTTRDANGVNPVFIGRIRKNLAFNNGISFWCVADNIRIGAALNTVRICKKVIEMGVWGRGK